MEALEVCGAYEANENQPNEIWHTCEALHGPDLVLMPTARDKRDGAYGTAVLEVLAVVIKGACTRRAEGHSDGCGWWKRLGVGKSYELQ